MTRYANVYQYDGPLGSYQFTDAQLGHETRKHAAVAALWELDVEGNTRRIGLLHIHPKAGVAE
jgi:hypothetical protein